METVAIVQRPGSDGGDDDLALFSSAECDGLELLGTSGSTIAVAERELATFLVEAGRMFEVMVTLLEFAAPLLTTDLLPVPRGTGSVGGR